MPKDLKDFPRPPSDNGRGLCGSASTGWSGGREGYDYWIAELVSLGIKWFKVLDSGGDSLELCTKLLAAGIFPIVRVIRKDPPPNDAPEPNPGHINATEEDSIKRLIAAGVCYFETNNEPNLDAEWKNGAMPGDAIETAKLVALNWLFDARFILAAGGLPGLPAVSSGGSMDLMGALVALGRQDILLEGCWLALHNYGQNRPLDFPDDPVNRAGQPITPGQYDLGAYTQWAWWNNGEAHTDTLDQVNAARLERKSPGLTIQQDHACFREFEFYNLLAMKYLGRSIPVISTECGYVVGRREDTRYPRMLPGTQLDLTVAMFDYMQRQAPDYYFAALPSMMVESPDKESQAWYSSFWKRTFQKSAAGHDGMPTIPVPGVVLADRLPVIEGVKAMPNLARRLPGAQPAPPALQPHVSAAPPKPASLKYVVMPGDTLSKIAKQFGTSWQQIAAANQLSSPDVLRAGQTLSIPRPAEGAGGQEPKPTAPSPEAPQVPGVARPEQVRPGLAALLAESENKPAAPAPTTRVPSPPAPPTGAKTQAPPLRPIAPVPNANMAPLSSQPQAQPPTPNAPAPTSTPTPAPAPITPAPPPPPAPAEYRPATPIAPTPTPAPAPITPAPPPPPVPVEYRPTPPAPARPPVESRPASPVPTPPVESKPAPPAPPPPAAPSAPAFKTTLSPDAAKPQTGFAPAPPTPPRAAPPSGFQPPAPAQRMPPPPPPLDLESVAPRSQIRPQPAPPRAAAPPAPPRLAPPPKLPDFSAPPPAELEWDWRLDALGVALDPAPARPGQEYWRLVKAVYLAPDEAGDSHQIQFTVIDEYGQPIPFQRVWQAWPSDQADSMTNERGETSIPLWESYAPDRGEGGTCYAWVDGLPTDRVYGMGLPGKRHVSFLLTWQRTIK